MPIAASRPVAGLSVTTNLSSYAMTAFTPTANSLLVVFVSAVGTVAAAPTMTGGSLTWTRELHLTSISGSVTTQAIFWAKVGGSPVSTAPTFDCTGDAATGCSMTCIQFTGYDSNAANPIQQTKISAVLTNGTNGTITFDAALNTLNGYAIALVGAFTTAGNVTPPASWTEADDGGVGSPGQSLCTAYRAGGETTAGPFTFTHASTTWLTFGCEVKVENTIPNKIIQVKQAVNRANTY